MQIVISPAKSLDFETPVAIQETSDYRFTKESQRIVSTLKKYSSENLVPLMNISTKLADLNYTRYQNWHYPFNKDEGKQALFAFKGEVYVGIDAYTLNDNEIKEAQNKLRILSGLYGLLRPLDLILPYRLEMGTRLTVGKNKNLYEYWGNKITHALNKDMQENNHSCLINLASNEYFKSIRNNELKFPIISPEFKDSKNGEYKVISFYAKKARGLMTRFIIENAINTPEELKAFDYEGYYYNNQLSTEQKPVFTRDH